MMNMNKIYDYSKKHWIAPVFALLVGAIYILPQAYFLFQPGYRGVFISRAPDEERFFSNIHEASEGKLIGNPYIWEYKDQKDKTEYNFFEYAFGYFEKISGIGTAQFAFIIKFLFPALLFLLAYTLMYFLTERVQDALLGGIFLLLGNELVQSHVSSFLSTLQGKGPFVEFLMYNRVIHPSVDALFFFGAIIFAYKILKNPSSKIFIILLGIIAGALAYIYFFYWAFVLSLCFILIAYAIISRQPKIGTAFLASTGITFIISIPFFIRMYHEFVLSGVSNDITNIQKAFAPTHQFIFEKVIIAPLVLCLTVLFLLYKRSQFFGSSIQELRRKYSFVLSLLLTSFVVSNQQVITGVEIQQHHFHFFTNIPIFLLSFSVFLSDLFEFFFKKSRKILITLLILFTICFGAGVQASSYNYWASSFKYYQNYLPVFSWLNSNSKKDSVILSDEIISEMIPMYTNSYVYSAGHAAGYPIAQSRLRHNYFISLYLRGIGANISPSYLYREDIRNEIGQYVFEGQYYRDRCGSYGCFLDSVLDGLVQEYLAFLNQPFEINLKKYKIDYIVWDTNKDKAWNLEQYKFLEEEYQNDGIIVYKVI